MLAMLEWVAKFTVGSVKPFKGFMALLAQRAFEFMEITQ
jgi:hypothetical protein